jgi:hypothetical protein
MSSLSALWSIWSFLQSEAGTAILVALFGLSETLAVIPQIQSNSVFQAIYNVLKKLAGK